MNWDESLNKKIESLTSDYSFTKYNQLKISSLKKLIELSYLNASSCNICNNHHPELEKMADQIPMLNDIEFRQAYEKKFNEMRMHFIKKHGFYAPMHFTSLWSLFFIAGGLLTGLATSLVFKNGIIIDWIIIPTIIALIIGYIIGSYFDRKIRIQKNII